VFPDFQYQLSIREQLKGVKGIHCLKDAIDKIANYYYFTILVQADYSIIREDLYHELKNNGFDPRGYFYMLISDFPMYRGWPFAHRENLSVAPAAAKHFLRLPIYPDLVMSAVNEITRFIVGSTKVATKQMRNFTGEAR
jgi:dTDP-4-amino-4,6-dideoxygalactose transaminase